MKTVKQVEHPAEIAAPTVGTALTAILVAFGVDPVKAVAISGVVVALTPAAVTFARNRDWL